MRTLKVGELILDYTLYPRSSIDRTNVAYIRQAIEGGATMPPLVICGKTKRIVDGFHRHTAYMGLFGGDHRVEVIEKRYKSDGELFADAMRYNVTHGVSLSRYDRIHCALRGEQLKLTVAEVADALHMKVDALQELRVARVATTLTLANSHPHSEQVPLKRSIRHMVGKELTSAQAEANRHLSGMDAMFHVNQLVSLMETGLLDLSNGPLMERLNHLSKLIRRVKNEAA